MRLKYDVATALSHPALFRNSLWVLPACVMVIALILVRLLHWLESEMGLVGKLNPDSVRAVLGTLAGAMFTFIVFMGSSLLLVVQLASPSSRRG